MNRVSTSGDHNYATNTAIKRRVDSCFVPMCPSTSTRYPNKLFLSGPSDPKLRKKWFQAARRNDNYSPKTIIRCCEDHFDLENDVRNWIKFKIFGGNLYLKKEVVPHIFECQNRMMPLKPRSAVIKRKRHEILRALKMHQRSVAGKQLPAAELDEVIIDDEEGRSVRGEQPEESRAEVSHENNISEHGETSHVTDLHEEVQCNECLGDIIGFRYICMQCADWELCGACEARAAHAHHLVLRVPKPHTYSETQRMIDTIRSSISTFLQPMKEEERESYEIEVKEEVDSDADDSNDDYQLNPDPELNMYPEARTQRAMLKLTKEVQVLVNVPNSELVLDPLSSSEERAVPTTSLGHDKPKIKLKRDQLSSLVAMSSHSSTGDSDQHQDTNMIKEEPIAAEYEASIDSEQNKDSYSFSVSPQTIKDDTSDRRITKWDHNVPSQALKRKKYS